MNITVVSLWAHSIVDHLLAHLGGTQAHGGDTVSGEVERLATGIDQKVDLILSGHTHTKINARINGILVTQAFSKDTALSRVDVDLDSAGNPTNLQAQVISTYADNTTPDAAVEADTEALLRRGGYEVGHGHRPGGREHHNKGDKQTPMGSLVADAIREAAQAQIGFTNEVESARGSPPARSLYGTYST